MASIADDGFCLPYFLVSSPCGDKVNFHYFAMSPPYGERINFH